MAGRASILVPLPGAIDDHQAANARALTGAAVIRQADCTPARLAAELGVLFGDPARVVAAAALAARAAPEDAAGALAGVVERLAAGLGAVG